MIYIILIWAHTFADFIMQTDRMAINKSSSNEWLTKHILTYTACLLPFGLLFASVNGAAHFVIDYFTSRMTTKLYKEGKRHNFFAVIGIDQALHITVLFVTIPLIDYWGIL